MFKEMEWAYLKELVPFEFFGVCVSPSQSLLGVSDQEPADEVFDVGRQVIGDGRRVAEDAPGKQTHNPR